MSAKYTTYVIEGEHYIKYDQHKALIKGYEDSNKKLQDDHEFWRGAYMKLDVRYDSLEEAHSDMQVEYICQKEKYDELRLQKSSSMANYIVEELEPDDTLPEVKKKKKIIKGGKKLTLKM